MPIWFVTKKDTWNGKIYIWMKSHNLGPTPDYVMAQQFFVNIETIWNAQQLIAGTDT